MSKQPIVLCCVTILLGIVLLVSSACSATQQPQTIKILLGVPSTSPQFVEQVEHASTLAFEAYNGQDENRRVELVQFDNYDKEAEQFVEQPILEEMIDDPAIVAVISVGNSDAARETIPFLNRMGITFISLTASWPGLTKPGFAPGEPGIFYPSGQRNFFRMIPSDDVQATATASWLREQDIQTVYIVHTDSVYSSGLANVFLARVPLEGLEIVGQEQVTQLTEQEEQDLAQRIAEANPDVLIYYVVDFSDASLEIAIRTHNPNLTIVGGETMTLRDLPDDTSLLEGMYATNLNLPIESLTAADDVVATYETHYGDKPSTIALVTYEAVYVVLQAIANAEEPTREGVLRAMHDLGDITGVLGTWSFNASGDISLTTVNLLQLQDGEWVSVEVFQGGEWVSAEDVIQ